MTEQTNYFEKMNKVNVSEHIEKKGKFSYLSWPFAVQQLGLADPSATWEVIKDQGLPYIKTECGFFVEVAVTVQGTRKTQIHPVLNGQNKPIEKPNAFDINTSIQRCLVKAIALHGLGLYIYAGEDLPEGEDKVAEEFKKEFSTGDSPGKLVEQEAGMEGLPIETVANIRKEAKIIEGDFYTISAKNALARWVSFKKDTDEQEQRFCWSLLDSKVRSGIKKIGETVAA